MKQIVYLFILPMMIWSQSNFDEAEKLFNDKSMNRHYIRSTSKNESVKFKTIEYLEILQAVTRNGMTRCFTTKVKTNKTI
jgi:hypothetical protein